MLAFLSENTHAALGILGTSCLILGGCGVRDGTHQASQMQLSSQSVAIDYLLYLPPQYKTAEQNWPLVLFLHGAGQCGSDIEQVKEHGLPRCIEEGADFPFLVVSPQSRNHGWDVDVLADVLDAIVERYNVDVNRIYVTGLSMGGFGAWRLAAHSPERFAAVVPICGGGDTEQADRLTDLPIWAFHGAQDDVVPVRATREMVAAVKAAGGTVRYTEYPDATHDCWTRTYDNPELYAWLLDQKRQ